MKNSKHGSVASSSLMSGEGDVKRLDLKGVENDRMDFHVVQGLSRHYLSSGAYVAADGV